MSHRPQVARAVEPNVGTRRAYKRKLIKLFSDYERETMDEILLFLAQKSLIATDWSLSNPRNKEDKQLLRRISKGVLSAMKRDPETFKNDVEGFVAKHIFEWVTGGKTKAYKLALWVARAIASDVSAAQRQAYIASGVPLTVLRKKWTVPIVKQFMSPTAKKRFPLLVEWATNLITGMLERDTERIQQVIIKSFLEGKSVSEVRKALLQTRGFNEDRATNVALDQTNKIAHGIKVANDEDLGIEEGIWIHVAGRYTSRKTHIAMNGKKFKLKEGLFDSDVGKNVQPTECYYCRCIYRPVLNWDKLK